MLKYFIDCEFLEGTQTEYGWLGWPLKTWSRFGTAIAAGLLFLNIYQTGIWLGSAIGLILLSTIELVCWSIKDLYMTPPTIDLISIGIVAEDGRELYLISKDFNLDEAWNRFQLDQGHGDQRNDPPKKVYWLRENVLRPIFYELMGKDIQFHDIDRNFTKSHFRALIKHHGKTNAEIVEEVVRFVMPSSEEVPGIDFMQYQELYSRPKFYGYYSDYDWVVFCWLFGKMIDLPKGFPMYCIDLKQMFDEKMSGDLIGKNQTLDPRELVELRALPDLKSRLKWLKNSSRVYPKQSNEHNALADAKWNLELYKFLQII